jgi:hypothetical protein
MRYQPSDGEWATIRPVLPNKARGVPRADDWRVWNWPTREDAPGRRTFFYFVGVGTAFGSQTGITGALYSFACIAERNARWLKS